MAGTVPQSSSAPAPAPPSLNYHHLGSYLIHRLAPRLAFPPITPAAKQAAPTPTTRAAVIILINVKRMIVESGLLALDGEGWRRRKGKKLRPEIQRRETTHPRRCELFLLRKRHYVRKNKILQSSTFIDIHSYILHQHDSSLHVALACDNSYDKDCTSPWRVIRTVLQQTTAMLMGLQLQVSPMNRDHSWSYFGPDRSIRFMCWRFVLPTSYSLQEMLKESPSPAMKVTDRTEEP